MRIGLIGAGGYVTQMLLPHFKNQRADFRAIQTASGVSANNVGKKFGFARGVSTADEVINDPDVNLVVIGTQHDLHATLTCQALEANRDVFAEKPLALRDEDLEAVLAAAQNSSGRLMVGFTGASRPRAESGEIFARRSGPLSLLYRVNAGRIPREHWPTTLRKVVAASSAKSATLLICCNTSLRTAHLRVCGGCVRE